MIPDAAAAPHVLREYSFLADGQRGALVGPRGDMSWLCVPGWDDDAVFATLLGGRGMYSITPVTPFVWGGSYEPGTLLWRSRWVAGSSEIGCREALAFPGDPHRAVVLRRIVAERGDAELDVLLRPAACFGARPLAEPRLGADGVWRARSGPLRLRWSGAPEATVSGSADDLYWKTRIRVPAGEYRDLVLELADIELRDSAPDPENLWAATESAWKRQVPAIAPSVAPRDAVQAYAVLRGMTCDTGGMVAAATTSLPERADQGENYDYRYTWIRDQCMAGQAVAAAGAHPLLDAAVSFTAERLLADGPDLAPAYTTSGRPVPATREIELPGYPGAQPVVGNRVRKQFQLDVFGEALSLFAAAGRAGRLTDDHRRAVRAAVDAIADRYDRPDAGIWEIDDRLWTHSRLTCAAGLRAVSACDATGAEIDRCTAIADQLMTETSRTSLHADGGWQRAPDLPEVDAALLLPMIRGVVPAADPRYRATFRAVLRELCSDHYIFRYRHEGCRLGDSEGAFLLCGFTMSIAAAQLGEPVTAMRFFERNRAACGTPGLFAEEFDVTERQLRGNLPQAFVHALLLESSIRLAAVQDSPDR